MCAVLYCGVLCYIPYYITSFLTNRNKGGNINCVAQMHLRCMRIQRFAGSCEGLEEE
jgi:hypothetical protein